MLDVVWCGKMEELASAIAPKLPRSIVLSVDNALIYQRKFARLAVMPEVAGLFYERLFVTNPSFRSLFKNDMRIQGIKLMATLAMIVYNLAEPGQALPEIRDPAVRHVKYGVKLADYDAMWEALLWTFEQALGKDFTAAVKEAWTVCYDGLAGEMKAAAGA